MPIFAFGINHKTAPVEIRERVAFTPERLPEALQQLVKQGNVSEAAILSTCNRTELYCGMHDDDVDQVLSWFHNFHNLSRDDVEPFFYAHPEKSAVQHMLRVASGLDSLVLGEPQILGQMKQAYSSANNAKTVGPILNRLFQHTFSVAKQVRSDTAIGASPVSVAFAAVSLSKQIFSGFENHTALLIGAGETIELVARHLHENGIGRLIIANRTVEKAHTLASELGGYAIALSELPDHLAEADIVISSTASQLPILGKGAVESALKRRKHRPMMMVDIAVPRDIEAEVGNLDDIYLYTVDDLKEIIDEGLKSRQEAAQQAEEIIDNQVTHFLGWMRSLDAVDAIREFRESGEEMRNQATETALRQLQSGKDPEQVVQELARQLTNRLLHTPCEQMREAGYNGRVELLDAASELFQLNSSPQKGKESDENQ
ncbi:MAG: glutamyl-tRNA reductase [Gammaproteobacteria bacterium]|nr:glutamyl-tRNA reductase [Gammaproteobacteria bacterium]